MQDKRMAHAFGQVLKSCWPICTLRRSPWHLQKQSLYRRKLFV